MIDSDLADTLTNTVVSGLVGLLVAGIAFPGRWIVEWCQQRRQSALTIAREARRELRKGVIESRTKRAWIRGAEPGAQVEKGIGQRRISDALEQVLWQLRELPQRRLYDLVESAVMLYPSAHDVYLEHPSEAFDDPEDALLQVIDDALSARVRRRSGGLRGPERQLRDLEAAIKSARQHAQEKYEARRKDAREQELPES